MKRSGGRFLRHLHLMVTMADCFLTPWLGSCCRRPLKHAIFAAQPGLPLKGRPSKREGLAMSQVSLQRFQYRAAAKSEFDQAWTIALQTFAKTGNWGGAESGVRHLKSYGTAWGGY